VRRALGCVKFKLRSRFISTPLILGKKIAIAGVGACECAWLYHCHPHQPGYNHSSQPAAVPEPIDRASAAPRLLDLLQGEQPAPV
jgi:hypothetical protein